LALKKYGGDSSTSPVFASTIEGVCADDTGPGAEEGSIVQTAINYSWPEYHSAPYVKMKPSYARAVSEAKANGEYIGGISFPGVDCGGFITRVMRNSSSPASCATRAPTPSTTRVKVTPLISFHTYGKAVSTWK